MGFRDEACLGPNKGRGEVELLGATAGKGLVAVAVNFCGEACLGLTEGRGEVELLGVIAGKGLVAVAVSFEMV